MGFTTKTDWRSKPLCRDRNKNLHLELELEQELQSHRWLGSSHDWLLTTDGHRTVVEFSDGDPDKYLEILKGQIKKDFDIHVTTPEIASHREELEELASNVGAKIYFYSGDTVVDALMEYLDVEYSKGKGQRLSDETGACGLDDKVDWSKY